MPDDSWTGVLESPPGAEVQIDGKPYLYFAGTAYFALQGHPAVIQAGCDAFRRYGVHSATSRGGYGTSPSLLEVEQLAADYFQADAAFYFLSGYWGNNIIVGGLAGHYDVIFYDEHSHYSIMESIQLARCPAYPFVHRNPDDLALKFREHLKGGQRPLVLTDGIFASSGRIAPVDRYLELLQGIPNSLLVLDDAHAVGVLGDGRGTYAEFGISSTQINRHPTEPAADTARLYCCGTLSKAIGGSGGIVAGSAAWISHLKSTSRYFNAASSPSAPIAAATAAALGLVMTDPSIRQRQQNNARHLRTGLRKLGLEIEDTSVPFTGLIIKDASHMQMLQRELRKRGIIIAYAKVYSGVASAGQLRIAVSSAHTESMIDRLLREFASLLG